MKVTIQQRNAELLQRSNVLESLGVPLKKSPNLSPTFAVPPPKKKIVFAKPIASHTPFTPEPTLDDSTYQDILKIIHDVGVEIERHPSIYTGKDDALINSAELRFLQDSNNA